MHLKKSRPSPLCVKRFSDQGSSPLANLRRRLHRSRGRRSRVRPRSPACRTRSPATACRYARLGRRFRHTCAGVRRRAREILTLCFPISPPPNNVVRLSKVSSQPRAARRRNVSSRTRGDENSSTSNFLTVRTDQILVHFQSRSAAPPKRSGRALQWYFENSDNRAVKRRFATGTPFAF